MAAKMQHFDPPSSASSESDDEVCLGEKEIFLVDELCEDAEHYRRSDIGTPTPQSPRPPSTGSQRSPRSRRQRTTSLSQSSKKTSAESILRSKTRTIYTAGRPPWYNSAGQQVEPFVIGICGGSASGKTTVATKIIESLDVPWVTLLSMDSFYKVLNEKQHEMAARNEYNFDHPDAFDFELLKTTLQRLKEGRMVEVPIYNFVTHCRESRTDVTVETPQGVLYNGKRAATDKICGVSILRAGETMEQAVRDVCKDIRIGKILIQTNQQTGEPELYYLRLPKDIKDYKVILMDATVATGAAAIMAIRVLLDHDVAEENVLLVSLLMAESGVHSIAYAFPRVKIVTSALDPVINEKFYVLPGIGNFGDRYFGTEPSSIDD
ncbi:uridine-cytidine kinase-like 1 [Apis mellifera caucasica]|nr:uridine-cytidine kinase-like 1 [Apis mellifera caucasica]